MRTSATSQTRIFGKLQNSINKTAKEADDLGNKGNKSGKSFNDSFLGVAATLGVIVTGLEKLGGKVLDLMEQGNAITETSNMYYQSLNNVSSEYKDATNQQSKFYTSGLAYQKMLHEQLGLNTEQMEKYQAMYFNMLNGQQGITSDLAYKMSENLTNLAIDMSSLFNTDIDTMTQKLQSGITGQAKALRQFGIDVTEASMASTLMAYGIDASVDSLSYGEKELLRYLTIVRQVNYAEGDFSNTFNTSANQIRVLKEEIKTLAQSTGLIFSQALSGAIIFARAVVRVLQQMVTEIAKFFHVDLTGVAENEGKAINGITDGISSGIGKVGNSIGGATKKAKEFKKQLMGFDEINNITPPATSSGGGGGGGLGGGVGGINGDLLKALENADWDLGIGDQVDEINKKVEELANNPLFKLLTTGLLAAGIVAVGDKLGKLISSFGGLKGAAGGAAGGLTGFQSALLAIDIALAAFDIAMMVSGWEDAGVKIDLLSQNLKKTYDTMGIAGGEAAAKTVEILSNIQKPLLAMGVGFDKLTGNAITKWVSSWTDGMFGMAKGTSFFMQQVDEDLYKVKKTFEETQAANKETIDNMTGSSRSYLAELSKIVDSNGQVKQGYEAIAKTLVGELAEATGMQIELSGNQITLNGEQITSYQSLEQAINDQIAAKEKELNMQALEAQYSALLQERSKIYVQLQEANAEYDAAVESGDQKRIQQAQNTVQNLQAENARLSKDIKDTAKEITSQTALEMNKLTADMIKNKQVNSKTVQEIYKTNKDSWKQTLSELDTDTQAELLSLTTSFDNLDQDLAEDWKNLAKSSEDGSKAFNNELLMMDDMTRIKLLSMTGNFEDLDEDAKKSIADFANTSPEKYQQALSGMSSTTRDQFQAMVNSINNKKGELSNASTDAANKIEQPITRTRDKGWTWGNDFTNNLAKGIKYGTIIGGPLGGAVGAVVALIKNKLGHSVPKEGDLHDDDKWGLHFIQNLANGIKNNEGILDKAVQGITTIMSEPFTSNEGIVVDKNVNANSMVDYSAVTGQIKTSINSGNIAEGIAVAVQQALRRANINVNVEAHADAGIIVETAVEGINNITRQTNEFPLEIPI